MMKTTGNGGGREGHHGGDSVIHQAQRARGLLVLHPQPKGAVVCTIRAYPGSRMRVVLHVQDSLANFTVLGNDRISQAGGVSSNLRLHAALALASEQARLV